MVVNGGSSVATGRPSHVRFHRPSQFIWRSHYRSIDFCKG